jgi:TRAP-type C4-dicarboxylate transport system permease small subunit
MIRQQIDKFIATVLSSIMALMVLNVLWQVFTRFVMGNPSSFTDELARYLMIWVGVLGAAYISGKNMHVAIDVVSNKLSEKKQKKLSLLVHWIVILFSFTALVVGGLRLVYITAVLHQNSPALHIPLAVVYVVIPLSGILIIYYKLNDILTRQL